MENEKILYADQYNISWNILDKRAQMIANFSNYSMRLGQYKSTDKDSKNIVISCIIYLYNEISSLQTSRIKKIKQHDDVIGYDEAIEIYNNHISKLEPWTYEDLKKMFIFTLEMCRVSGVADPGYKKADPGLAIMSD